MEAEDRLCGCFSRDHVVERAPERACDASSIAAPAFVIVCIARRLAAFADTTIPDDLHGRVACEGARQQLVRGEVPTPHDDKFRVAHESVS